MAKQNRRPITITIFLIFLVSATISPLGNKKHQEENVTLDEYYSPDGVPSASFQRDGLPMSPGTGDQLYPKMCPDGEGGIITIWSSPDEDLIYAQRINATGDQYWGSGKTIPATGLNAEITSDGNGGAYIIWRDENFNVKAQRIDSDGNEVWTSGGIYVFNQGFYCADLQLVSDSQGGVIIGWGDSRSEDYGMQNFYAQRINSTGDALWTPNGTAVIEAAEQQVKLRMLADGTGNTYFAWEDGRNDPEYDDWRDDIYAQKLDIDGNQLWGVSGIAVCHANHRQVSLSLSLATGGGIYLAWMDYRTESSYDIYMQFLNSGGAAQWIADGIVLCDTSSSLYSPKLTSDNEGGFYTVWYDQFDNKQLFAQQVNSTGDIQWITDGFVVTPDSQVSEYSIANDTQGNLYLEWVDLRNGESDIFVQKFNSSGDVQYPEGGVALCLADGSQGSIQMVVSGQTPYCTWVDSRSSNTRIYLSIISSVGIANINSPASVITDAFDTETIDWTIVHPTSSTGEYRIMVYDWSEVTQNLVIDWTSWLNDTNLAIPINRTSSGEFTYIIQYYDDTSYLISQSEVNVSIVNYMPTIFQPTITTTTKYSSETIDWIIDDDFSGGQYRIFANTTEASQSIYQDWISWEVGVPLDVPIYREWPGFYNYSIEYYDNDLKYGVNASSLIEVVDLVPSTNSPADAAITEGEFYAIFWQIYDDYGLEKYQIWLNGSTAEETDQVWIDWIWLNSTQWGNKTFVLIPTIPAVGNYTYTLEFYTITGEHYMEEIFIEIAEPVVVDQTESILDALTGPDSILFYGSSGVALVAVIVAISSQLKLKKLGNPGGKTT